MPAERSGAPSTCRRAKTKSSPTIAMSASTRRSKPIFSKRCRRPSSRVSPHHVDGLPRRRLPIIALARRQLDALAVLASLQQAVLELRHRGEPVDQEEGDDRQQQRHRQAGEAGGKAVVFLLVVAGVHLSLPTRSAPSALDRIRARPSRRRRKYRPAQSIP